MEHEIDIVPEKEEEMLSRKPLVGQLKYKIESSEPKYAMYTKACVPMHMQGVIRQYYYAHRFPGLNKHSQPFWNNLVIVLIAQYSFLGIHKPREEVLREALSVCKRYSGL